MSMEHVEGKVTLGLNPHNTILDCEDPELKNNANCLTYSYGEDKSYKAPK